MSYESARECCGNLDGMADVPFTDWTGRETTEDQERIESVLESRDLDGARILHAGIGGSGLAKRLAERVLLIDGLTVNANEKVFGDSLGLRNYTIHKLDKQSRDFNRVITNRYDYIVDNNLAGFACCKYHFYLMLDNFLWALEPGGEILTDQYGLDWACFDPGFTMTYEDLASLAGKFPVDVSKVTDKVYSLRSLGRHRPPSSPITVSYRAVERDGKRVVEPRPAHLPE